MHITTEININASKEKVWKVFSDFDNYPDWNPFVKKVTGQVMEGRKIKVDLPGMKFQPRIVSYKKDIELKWLGHLFIKGLFDGQHSFEFRQNKDGSTQFIHSENFSGVLVGLFRKMLINETKPGFDEMNRALKERVENLS